MENVNQRKNDKLAESYIGAKWIIELLDDSMSIKKSANLKYMIFDANGTSVGTIESAKDCDGYYYCLHIKNDSYYVHGEIKQNGVCYIRILDGKFKDYEIAFTFMGTNNGDIVRQVEIFNPENQKISLSWCTWGQGGFNISNSYAKVELFLDKRYYMQYDYRNGSGLDIELQSAMESEKNIILKRRTRERIKPKLPQAGEITRIISSSELIGHTIDEYISNDSFGTGLLSQFDCLYSQLPFTKSLREIISEDLIISSGLSLLFEAVDKGKGVSQEQRIKTLDDIIKNR